MYALPPGAEDAAGYVIPDSNQPAVYSVASTGTVVVIQGDQAYALPRGAEDDAGYAIPDSNQPALYTVEQGLAAHSYASVDEDQFKSIVEGKGRPAARPACFG